MLTFRTIEVLEPIRTKIEKLDLLKSGGPEHSKLSKDDVYHVMKDIYDIVSQCPELEECKHNEEAYVKLKICLNNFNMTLQHAMMKGKDLDCDSYKQISSVTGELLESVCQVLLNEESATVERLKDSISRCRIALDNLQKTNSMVNFKNFVDEVLESKQLLKTHAFNLISKKQRNLILLCVNQIDKCIFLMLKTYQYDGCTSTVPSFKESMQYLSARLKWCFSELSRVVEASDPSLADKQEECGGLFVQRMDHALEILAAVKVDEEFHNVVSLVKDVIEEVLCHAMAIAQVSVPQDSAAITLCCQKVLNALENIKNESALEMINTSVRQNLCYILADTLESLERQVNNSLLRLVLKVFCESSAPLKNLVEACAGPVVNCCADLDDMIVKLDLHVDRIMQIGMFAMACSADVKRILGIRSCLASLESLEPELVPALTAYYLNVEKSGHRNHVKMLSCHWQNEVLNLEKLIDGIVDPAAFCQIIFDDVHQLVKLLKTSLHREKLFLKDMVHKIYVKSAKLVRHLSVSTHEMEPLASQLNISLMVKELNMACDECRAAASIVFSEEGCDEDSLTYMQLLKRCKLIVSLVKKLQPELLELMSYCQSDTKKSADRRGDNDLNFPSSIKDLPLDISDSRDKEECSKLRDLNKNEENLQPFLERGRQLCQERSILYQTPKSAKKMPCLALSSQRNDSKQPVDRRLFSRDDSVSEKEESVHLMSINDTLGLEITEILDKLTSLSDTLSPEHESYSQ